MKPLNAPIFSLTRFFHSKEKTLPCCLAGRFYPESKNTYRLKSQNLSILCQSLEGKLKAKAGDWLLVRLLSKKNNVYQTEEVRVLKACQSAPQEPNCSLEILQDWQSFLAGVRDFFYSEGLACVETPSLVQCPGTEPHLEFFETKLNTNNKTQKVYLASSPEMNLKKLLCQDWTDFFEIKKCYRNGELSSTHQPEFYLLEWYRAFYSTRDLIKEVYKLLSFLKQQKFCKVPLAPAEIYSCRDLFKKHLGFSLQPETSKKELLDLLKAQDLEGSLEDSFEDLFFLLFLNKIEPHFPKKSPVFVCEYPPQLRAFAQLNSKGWADRFELYWQGFELGNAFYEVNDPLEQKKIFEEHLKQRKDSVPLDEELLSLLQQGMPAVSGIAIGLDRLFLALYDKRDLKNIRLFSYD